MSKYKKCSIYFDTNAFERRHTSKELFLYTLEASELFYGIRDTVLQLGLKEYVQLCIPEIVWREVKQHLIEKFNATIDSFNGKIAEVKKSCGELLDIHYELNGIDNVDDYPEYVEEIASEFLNNPKNFVQITLLPRNDDMFNSIIDNAVQGIPPFNKAKSGGKEYNDAGLKDVLIWETIKQFDSNDLAIFVTNDCDFNKIKTDNIHICSNLAEVKSLLLEEMPVAQDISIINRLLDNDEYLLNQIMSEGELGPGLSAQVEEILENTIETDEMDRKTLRIVCNMKIEDTMVQVMLQYDLNANELIDVNNVQYLE
ncbi:MAG: PIN domain-containing protein [Lachnospiraceae bacterium]|nr:PIN domain-containing protein [Lachnospiraceae bacterium]